MNRLYIAASALSVTLSAEAYAECKQLRYPSESMESSEQAVSGCDEKITPAPVLLCAAKNSSTDKDFMGLQVYEVTEIVKTGEQTEPIKNGVRIDFASSKLNSVTYFEKTTATHQAKGSEFVSEFKLKEKYRTIFSDEKTTAAPSNQLERTVTVMLGEVSGKKIPVKIDAGDGRIIDCGFGDVTDSFFK